MKDKRKVRQSSARTSYYLMTLLLSIIIQHDYIMSVFPNCHNIFKMYSVKISTNRYSTYLSKKKFYKHTQRYDNV